MNRIEKLEQALREALDVLSNVDAGMDERSEAVARIDALLADQNGATPCRCTMREKLVGDGCSVCNPHLAAEFESDEPAIPAEQHDVFGRVYRVNDEPVIRLEGDQHISDGMPVYTAPHRADRPGAG